MKKKSKLKEEREVDGNLKKGGAGQAEPLKEELSPRAYFEKL